MTPKTRGSFKGFLVSSTLSNIFTFSANFLPTLIQFYQKTPVVTVATLVGGVGAAEYAKAIAKMKKVRSIIPNWGKECGSVGGQRCRVGIDRYQMFL